MKIGKSIFSIQEGSGDEESEWETYADVIVGGVVGEIGALAVGAVKVRFLSMLSVI